MKKINFNFGKTALNYFPAVIWAIVIYLLSAQQVLPGFSISIADFLFKKMAHISVYAVLYFLLFKATKNSFNFKEKHSYLFWLLPLIFCFSYALSDEFHQSLVAGRQATLRDVGYDVFGASLVMLKKLRYI